MSAKFVWRVDSGFGIRWDDGDLPCRLLDEVRQLRGLGPATDCRVTDTESRGRIDEPIEWLRQRILERHELVTMRAADWSAGARVYPPRADGTRGIPNGANVRFDVEDVAALTPKLVEAFSRIVHSGLIDYGVLHLDEHFGDFRHSHYSPVVLNIEFVGVFWANYWGPEVLANFDVDRLKALSSYSVSWGTEPSLLLFSAPDPISATTAEGERHLVELTEVFRKARVVF